jgi:hypothetical protein
VLTRAVLRYPGFDRFLEGGRPEYLTELLEAAGCVEQAISLVERALPRQRHFWRAEHLVELASYLAQKDSLRAREIVLNAFHRGREEDVFFGAEPIVEAEGLPGLVYVLEHLGTRLCPSNAEKLDWLRYQATKIEGEDQLEPKLLKLAESNELVERFLRCLPAKRRYRKPRPLPPMSFAEFRLKRAKRHMPRYGNVTPRFWVQSASDEEFRVAVRALEEERAHDEIKWLVRVVKLKPYPLRIGRIEERIKTEPLENGFFLIQALEGTRSKSVRRLALELFEDPRRWVFGCGLLRKNWRAGDEQLLLQLLQQRGKAATYWVHGPVGDVLTLVDEHPKRNWAPHLQWIYENSPCAYCRGSALRDMIERREASHEMLEECLLDSQLETREEARKALAGPL